MTTIVRFRTGTGLYAVPVEASHEVRSAVGLVVVPAAGRGLAGLLPRADDELPVLDALGSGDKHVLVLDDGTRQFGLLVDEVSGVVTVPADSIGAPPAGQPDDLVSGIVRIGEDIVLMVDPTVLARRLDP
jgi:chemotaxis signal transduction protein